MLCGQKLSILWRHDLGQYLLLEIQIPSIRFKLKAAVRDNFSCQSHRFESSSLTFLELETLLLVPAIQYLVWNDPAFRLYIQELWKTSDQEHSSTYINLHSICSSFFVWLFVIVFCFNVKSFTKHQVCNTFLNSLVLILKWYWTGFFSPLFLEIHDHSVVHQQVWRALWLKG